MALLWFLADSSETPPLPPPCSFLPPISASSRTPLKALVCFSQLPASIFHLTRYPILLLSAQIMLYPTPFPWNSSSKLTLLKTWLCIAGLILTSEKFCCMHFAFLAQLLQNFDWIDFPLHYYRHHLLLQVLRFWFLSRRFIAVLSPLSLVDLES